MSAHSWIISVQFNQHKLVAWTVTRANVKKLTQGTGNTSSALSAQERSLVEEKHCSYRSPWWWFYLSIEGREIDITHLKIPHKLHRYPILQRSAKLIYSLAAQAKIPFYWDGRAIANRNSGFCMLCGGWLSKHRGWPLLWLSWGNNCIILSQYLYIIPEL